MADAVGGGTPSQSSRSKTFAQALSHSLLPPPVSIGIKQPAFTDDGSPAVFFSSEEISKSMVPLKLAMIVKCSYGRPSIPEFKTCLSQHLEYKADIVISVLHHRHLLIRFIDEDDFARSLIRKQLYIKGFLCRFFRWSPSFNFQSNPTTIPIWVGMPGLPANFYSADFIKSIAINIGPVLRVHEATLALTQTAEALVCVELDLEKSRPDSIWIFGGNLEFWQKLRYYNIPHRCPTCGKIGHEASSCLKSKRQGSEKETLQVRGRDHGACTHARVNRKEAPHEPVEIWVPKASDGGHDGIAVDLQILVALGREKDSRDIVLLSTPQGSGDPGNVLQKDAPATPVQDPSPSAPSDGGTPAAPLIFPPLRDEGITLDLPGPCQQMEKEDPLCNPTGSSSRPGTNSSNARRFTDTTNICIDQHMNAKSDVVVKEGVGAQQDKTEMSASYPIIGNDPETLAKFEATSKQVWAENFLVSQGNIGMPKIMPVVDPPLLDQTHSDQDTGNMSEEYELGPLDTVSDDDFIPVKSKRHNSKRRSGSEIYEYTRVSKSGRIIRRPSRF